MTANTITPLQIAVAKQSVQGVIKAYLAENDGEFTQTDFENVLIEYGLPFESHKVSASLQSLATNGKIDRGVSKPIPEGKTKPELTYARKGSVDPDERAAAKALRSESAKAPKEKVARKVRKSTKAESHTYTDEEVFTHLIEQLGDPVDFQRGMLGPTFTLLGDSDPAYILHRAAASLSTDPDKWTVLKFGDNPNVSVMFIDPKVAY